ncbi:uncharacterized protein PADG_01663 [Paracoccidioides brasiliensis Pb18]|uniref:Uncharacterized protein n=1 Tax=Paracoccidioides brasiliensis (strain Pb18) TaxID=502780 RepID=C1G3Z7_PARBD|nr:uncharacterized protein PADG_01663 [Paracoccidioides brasiliensis Pb18]EEH45513.2 hypothetical protein PADG_01663 [Paracoccidioides brasiliensis Pb18]
MTGEERLLLKDIVVNSNTEKLPTNHLFEGDSNKCSRAAQSSDSYMLKIQGNLSLTEHLQRGRKLSGDQTSILLSPQAPGQQAGGRAAGCLKHPQNVRRIKSSEAFSSSEWSVLYIGRLPQNSRVIRTGILVGPHLGSDAGKKIRQSSKQIKGLRSARSEDICNWGLRPFIHRAAKMGFQFYPETQAARRIRERGPLDQDRICRFKV